MKRIIFTITMLCVMLFVVVTTSVAGTSRIVHGTVNSDGTIVSGTGFTSSVNNNNQYTVTFTASPAFTTAPDCVATPVHSILEMVTVFNVTSSGFEVIFETPVIANPGTASESISTTAIPPVGIFSFICLQ